MSDNKLNSGNVYKRNFDAGWVEREHCELFYGSRLASVTSFGFVWNLWISVMYFFKDSVYEIEMVW